MFMHFQPQTAEFRSHQGRRPLFLIRKLRMSMNRTAELTYVGRIFFNQLFYYILCHFPVPPFIYQEISL